MSKEERKSKISRLQSVHAQTMSLGACRTFRRGKNPRLCHGYTAMCGLTKTQSHSKTHISMHCDRVDMFGLL